MKLPEPVAYLHIPLETWGGKIRPVPSLLKYNEPDIYGEVINLYGENQVREAFAQQEAEHEANERNLCQLTDELAESRRQVAQLQEQNTALDARLASNEAVMRMALEALKQMMSIVAIHSRATKNNFAWAEMDEARAAIKALEEQLK